MKLNLEQKIQLKKLKDYNVKLVEIHYDGGGDDGMINDIVYYDDNDIGHRGYLLKSNNLKKLQDNLDNYYYQILCDNIDWDWVNNEGGFGHMVIDLLTEEVKIFHSQRHVEHYEYKAENESKKMFKIINGTS
tara:strand:+ start:149 stop:544 length:396 start_codon:yes stop_codon:yes gene_type:complete